MLFRSVRNMELHLPKGMEPIFCSSYQFMPGNSEYENIEDTEVIYMLDKDKTEHDFLTKIPEDNNIPRGQKGNVNFFCTLLINDGESLLGNTPFSIRYFRLTVDYKYEIFKEYPISFTKTPGKVDPGAFFSAIYRRPDPGCTTKTEDMCASFDVEQNKFCYALFEEIEGEEQTQNSEESPEIGRAHV